MVGPVSKGSVVSREEEVRRMGRTVRTDRGWDLSSGSPCPPVQVLGVSVSFDVGQGQDDGSKYTGTC